MPERFIIAYVLMAVLVPLAFTVVVFVYRQQQERRRISRGGRARVDRLTRRSK